MHIRGSEPAATTWARCVGMLVALLVLVGNVAVAADSPIRSIDVKYDGEAYVVDAVMFGPIGQAVAWEVLTDFDHMAQWVPNVAVSKVLKQEGNSVTVEQRGMARFGGASFPYVTERRIEMKSPSAIKTTQLKGSLRRVESLIALEPEGKGTRLIYHLEIVPSVLARAVMSTSFVEHEIIEQFTAIFGEMAHRARQ
jgi:hypothetical protein